MIDYQVDPRQQAAEVVRLHVDGSDAVEVAEPPGCHLFDVDVEQVGHAEVLGTRHALRARR